MHRHEPLDHIAYSNRWSRRHPGEKALLSLGLLLASVMLPPLPNSALILLITSLLALAGARVPARPWFGLLLTQAAFLGIASGPVAWQSGLDMAVRTVLRSMAATSCLLLLSLTTPLPHLFRQLGHYKALRPLAEFAAVIYRFVALGVDVVGRSRMAMRQRLGPLRTRTYWSLGGRVGGRLLTRLLQRSQSMERAYQCRGVSGLLPLVDDDPPLDRRYVTASLLLIGAVFSGGVAVW